MHVTLVAKEEVEHFCVKEVVEVVDDDLAFRFENLEQSKTQFHQRL